MIKDYVQSELELVEQRREGHLKLDGAPTLSTHLIAAAYASRATRAEVSL